MAWRYLIRGKIEGPVSDKAFAELRASLPPSAKVWKDGWEGWRALEAAEGELTALAAPEIPIDEATTERANFWARLAAWVLDYLLIHASFWLFSGAQKPWDYAGGMGWHSWNFASTSDFGWATAAGVAYETVMLQRYGATLGKLVVGLTVVHQGRRLSWLRALGRGLAKQLSGMICFVGYLIAAVDSNKKALHDHICQTSVFFKPKKASGGAAVLKAKKPKKARPRRKARG